MAARPESSTVTVAWHRETLSNAAKAAATRGWAGSRPSSRDVPAGTSTFPVEKAILSTTGEILRPDPGSGSRHVAHTRSAGSGTGAPQLGQTEPTSARLRYFCETVGDGRSSSRESGCGRFAPHRKQIKSSGSTLTAQLGQVRIAMSSSGTAWSAHHRSLALISAGLPPFPAPAPYVRCPARNEAGRAGHALITLLAGGAPCPTRWPK